jgi:cell division protein FtsQ
MPPVKKERKRPRNLRKLIEWYAVWTALTLFVVSVLAGFILSLPVWRVSSVQVVGNNYLSEAKIVNAAKIPQGENIFLIDLDKVKKRYSNVIQIKGINVKWKLPHTIVIDVKERTPFAIAVIGGVASLIDDEGYVIARQSLTSSVYRSDIAKFPVIRGINKKSLEGGIRLNSGDRSFVTSALNMLSKFIDLGTIQIEAGNREDIIIFIEDILKVKIGDQRDMEKKIMIVRAMLGSVKGKWTKVDYIDVRVPDNPVIKYK